MSVTTKDANIKVWDWSIRVFHWSLPILIFLLWWSQSQSEMERHLIFAQILLGLLAYRLVWGFIGTPYARFTNFIYAPKTYFNYLKGAVAKQKPTYLGHNPFGGLMVVVLLASLGFMLLTGAFTSDDIFTFGPLYAYVDSDVASWMGRWHSLFFDCLLIFIVLHLFAILVYKFLGENLVKAMFTGVKKSQQQEDLPVAAVVGRFPWVRFVLAVLIAALVVVLVFHVQY